MRKYTTPEIECKVFARENIMTASGGSQTQESSASILKTQLSKSEGIAESNILEAVWD